MISISVGDDSPRMRNLNLEEEKAARQLKAGVYKCMREPIDAGLLDADAVVSCILEMIVNLAVVSKAPEQEIFDAMRAMRRRATEKKLGKDAV